MLQRFFAYFSVILFVMTTIASPVNAQNMYFGAATNAITKSATSEISPSECSDMHKAKMVDSAKSAASDKYNDCCDQGCNCQIAHCAIGTLLFGGAHFTTLSIRIEKSAVPRDQRLASISHDPLKRPPRI